jgi:hypothetical protein
LIAGRTLLVGEELLAANIGQHVEGAAHGGPGEGADELYLTAGGRELVLLLHSRDLVGSWHYAFKISDVSGNLQTLYLRSLCNTISTQLTINHETRWL